MDIIEELDPDYREVNPMSSSVQKYNFFLENFPDAFAYHEVVWDQKGQPVDYIFRQVNAAFEEMTGLARDRIIGKKVTRGPAGNFKFQF